MNVDKWLEGPQGHVLSGVSLGLAVLKVLQKR